MPTGMFHYRTEDERLAIETAIAFVSEMHALAQTAPSGHVLSLCEQQALLQGRDVLRATLQNAVQARIAQAEKKGAKRVAAVPALAPCASSEATACGT